MDVFTDGELRNWRECADKPAPPSASGAEAIFRIAGPAQGVGCGDMNTPEGKLGRDLAVALDALRRVVNAENIHEARWAANSALARLVPINPPTDERPEWRSAIDGERPIHLRGL